MLSLLLRGALLYYGVQKSHTCQNNRTHAIFYFECDLVNLSLVLIMIVGNSLNICVVLKIITQQSPVFTIQTCSRMCMLYVIMQFTDYNDVQIAFQASPPLTIGGVSSAATNILGII